MLELALARRLGRFALALSLDVAAGETLVVAGESGAGKTTLLRLLAGLERPDSGQIIVGGRRWFDAARRIDIPAWQRSVGFVPQDYALFPHLTVADNVAFGLRAQGRDDGTATRQVADALEQLGVSEFARSRPGELSGGQQQRVALARALVLEPELLLLDEPLSALDLRTRPVVRGELRRILASLPCVTVYVTHTPSEALVLGDRIAVLEEGRLAQVGARDDFLRFPRSSYLAAFLGTNLIRGCVVASDAAGAMRVATSWGELPGMGTGEMGTEWFVRVDPAAISLHRERPVGQGMHAVQGRIAEMLPQPPAGNRVRVRIATEPALMAEIAAETALGMREDDVVWAAFAASDVECYR